MKYFHLASLAFGQGAGVENTITSINFFFCVYIIQNRSSEGVGNLWSPSLTAPVTSPEAEVSWVDIHSGFLGPWFWYRWSLAMDRSIELNLSLKRFTSRIHVVLRQERIKPNRVLYGKLRVKWTCVAQSDICRFRTRRFSISKLAVENKNLYRGLLIKSVRTANGISVLSFARAKSILCARPTVGFWIRDPVNRCCASSSLTTGRCRDTTEIFTIVHDDLELASDIVTVVYDLKSMNQILHSTLSLLITNSNQRIKYLNSSTTS